MAFHMTRPEQETLRRMLQNQATLEEKFNHDVIIMHIIPNGSINYYSKNQEVVNWLNENVQHIFSLFQAGNNNIRQPQDAMQPGEQIVNQPSLPTWPARNLNDISIDYLREFLRQICRKLLGLDKKIKYTIPKPDFWPSDIPWRNISQGLSKPQIIEVIKHIYSREDGHSSSRQSSSGLDSDVSSRAPLNQDSDSSRPSSGDESNDDRRQSSDDNLSASPTSTPNLLDQTNVNGSDSPIIPSRPRHQPRYNINKNASNMHSNNDSSSGAEERVNPRRKKNNANILVDDESSSSNFEDQISSNNIKKRKRQKQKTIIGKADATLRQLLQHDINKGKTRLKSATKPTKRGKLSALPKRRMGNKEFI